VLSIDHQLQGLISRRVCVVVFEVISSSFGSCPDILLNITQLKINTTTKWYTHFLTNNVLEMVAFIERSWIWWNLVDETNISILNTWLSLRIIPNTTVCIDMIYLIAHRENKREKENLVWEINSRFLNFYFI